MPTDHPRVNVVLERPLYQSLTRLAKRDGISLSLKMRDLVRNAMEIEEDIYWERKAQARSKTFSLKKSLSHEAVWEQKD